MYREKCASITNKNITEIMSKLPLQQQEAFKSCIAVSKVRHIHGMRYNTY